MASPSFDAQAVNDAATARVRSAERLRDAVTTALRELHALLDPEQRAQLAYLIRTGTLHI
jgi:Spy/CpxP family protein refolding chaperone